MHNRPSGLARSRSAFTLIELLVVIAIIAVLAVVVVLTLNPAELLRQSRDANRLSDMSTLVHAIGLYQEDLSAGPLGAASTSYISVPDANASTTAGDACQALGMATSTTWHCASSTYYRAVNSTGWLPINFTNMSTGAPLGSLPVDPTNQTSSGLYYSYATNGSTFEVSANPESQKYIAQAASSPNMFIAGSNTSLLTAGGVANGSVAQANMRLSVASNTAFVDFGVIGSLTPYIGDKITITDSSGNALVGYIKAAGTGETYGSQLLPNTAFSNTSNIAYSNATVASVAGGQSGNALQVTNTASIVGAANEVTATSPLGALIQYSFYGENGTSGYVAGWIDDGNWTQLLWAGFWSSSWMQEIAYVTPDTTSSIFVMGVGSSVNGQTTLYDTASAEQVLTPSTTGVTITSTANGGSYNWASQSGSFNLNDGGGYTYTITLY